MFRLGGTPGIARIASRGGRCPCHGRRGWATKPAAASPGVSTWRCGAVGWNPTLPGAVPGRVRPRTLRRYARKGPISYGLARTAV